MFGRLTLLAIFILAAVPRVAGAEYGDETYVYVAEYPRLCSIEAYGYDGQVFHVYVASGEFNDVTGVSFRILSERFGPAQVQSITTPADVSIVSGDPFDGITLSFSGRHLDHEPVLSIEVAGHDDHGNIETQDVTLIRGATTEPVIGFISWGWPSDCFGTSVIWSPPDTVDVLVDHDASFSFLAQVVTGSIPPMGYINLVDALGWTPNSFYDDVFASCFGVCPWSYTPVTIPVYIPKGTADKTLNVITVHMMAFGYVIDEADVVLRANNPNAVEETTWGRVKALYR